MRAAASSNASGMPSSRRTTSAIAAAFASVNSKSDCTETARAINRRAASLFDTVSRSAYFGSVRDGTTTMRSPAMPRPSRLVESTATPGQLSSSS